ncbi:MAG: M20/M25/M40 family metallo-hydrolase [Ilumatobacter sp.]|jgi:acetylornithine deacetylase/succinyl-diaminopimelate desuccinylase-like protein|uniref:M20/M25/M40 family metallo-hydrolase n=1 Tax=Ilumatobacter sp. TaxID=1967498 RepID=UPI001E11E61A|nr:M20/M25/M40 family metallo-hydrolase [Ilumatobacter sp.]MBT5276592.1 M20/M25/M40 family metallo-hydrolase [Ilumatobacter sp.]MBT5554044.1 M20/M25/M40 family metallo-hydrolase [Ilumatobacter sp.]MBT5865158.1 M20/M25/M40 family metallo-hydrolase [Ilumatobacter sp.]MBT7428737.1 M20/M25/M40 family metallo-hydrolase [Ilumatobacter sp.]
MTTLDAEAVTDHANNTWEGIVPVLHDYIAIPNVSLDFDPEWREHGFMAEAVDLIAGWCRDRPIPGMTLDVMELPGRTPMIVIEIPPAGGGAADDTVLLYGHLDKQPEMEGWRDDLGPWTPVLEGDRLYGRGGADDGYAAFASLTAIEAVHAAGGVHTRCVVLIEASEESGSPDLPAYIDALADTIGTPSLVVCLDSGCIDYDRMWVTTSLRGMVMGKLTVDIVTEGLHSGDASGMIPSTFRIARQLLERIEDSSSGELLLPELQVEVPAGRLAEAQSTAEEIGAIATHYPFVDGAGPTTDDPAEQLLARTWRGTLSVVGADGLPPAARAGNVLRPSTTLKLSFRLPPTADPDVALAAIIAALESDPPYGARVRFHETDAAPGWNAPATAPWLEVGLDAASNASFGQPARSFGEGGSIPFMGMLGEKFPEAQFVITGVLGPDANAHGPNEYLHVPTARKLTMAVAHLLNAHATR